MSGEGTSSSQKSDDDLYYRAEYIDGHRYNKEKKRFEVKIKYCRLRSQFYDTDNLSPLENQCLYKYYKNLLIKRAEQSPPPPRNDRDFMELEKYINENMQEQLLKDKKEEKAVEVETPIRPTKVQEMMAKILPGFMPAMVPGLLADLPVVPEKRRKMMGPSTPPIELTPEMLQAMLPVMPKLSPGEVPQGSNDFLQPMVGSMEPKDWVLGEYRELFERLAGIDDLTDNVLGVGKHSLYFTLVEVIPSKFAETYPTVMARIQHEVNQTDETEFAPPNAIAYAINKFVELMVSDSSVDLAPNDSESVSDVLNLFIDFVKRIKTQKMSALAGRLELFQEAIGKERVLKARVKYILESIINIIEVYDTEPEE